MNTINFQNHVRDTFERQVPFDSMPVSTKIEHGIIGIASEAGELLQVLRKGGYETLNYEVSIDQVVGELGDVLRYCAVLLNSLGLTFEEVFSSNAHKIDLRTSAQNPMKYLVNNPPEDWDR